MTSSEIKEKLIAEKAVRDRERIAAEAAIKHIKDRFSEITNEDRENLHSLGFDTAFIDNVDLNRMATDGEYLETLHSKLEEICTNLLKILEEEVNRQ